MDWGSADHAGPANDALPAAKCLVPSWRELLGVLRIC